MDVRERQRHGLLTFLLIGVTIYIVSIAIGIISKSSMAGIPWMDQDKETYILGYEGNRDYDGIYFLKVKDDFYRISVELELSNVSPREIKNYITLADYAVTIVKEGENKYSWKEMVASKRMALGLPINLNKASAEDLLCVPGIGVKMASKIIFFRNARGGINTLSDLKQLSGVTDRVIQGWSHYFCF